MPAWLALALATAGGLAAAVQSAANGELAERTTAPVAALVNNVGGALLVVVGLVLVPSLRSGLRAVAQTRLPWWAYLGGLGGAFFVVAAAYVVPTLGVAVFTISLVAGSAFGGLAVDRVGLAPTGRLPLTWPRLVGAVLGVSAVTLAQVGRPAGELTVGFLALAVAGGIAVALQAALNGRVSAAGNPGAATVVNFAVNTPALVAFAAAAGTFGAHWPSRWPAQWYLYVGGVLGVTLVVILAVCVRVVGVLRTNLALVGGQLGGAVLLDALLPGRAAPSPAVLAGVVLTAVAAGLAGWRR
jgi:transporter family-2 protein